MLDWTRHPIEAAVGERAQVSNYFHNRAQQRDPRSKHSSTVGTLQERSGKRPVQRLPHESKAADMKYHILDQGHMATCKILFSRKAAEAVMGTWIHVFAGSALEYEWHHR